MKLYCKTFILKLSSWKLKSPREHVRRAVRKCHEVQYCVSNNYGGKLIFGQGTNLLVHTSKWFCI